jgi:signal transduction protein with GAF and PtsI domain
MCSGQWPTTSSEDNVSTETYDEILRATARLARLSFSAAAASIFLYDQEEQVLRFEACSGVGQDELLGMTIPPDRGIAGWVANTGEPLVIQGVADDERFDRDFAMETGLVPDTILAAPVEHRGEILGVLEVLDPKLEMVGSMVAIDMLTELANQSCAALSLILADRRARARQTDPDGPMARLARLLEGGDPAREAAVGDLLHAIERLVR